ncbi:hypothetical protein [Denitromonas halophila]|uniref:Uncharacterized protein n=1 Tax=Denitromonas halophila TaxID=1629404 RepID=A0A557QLR2_9RHOO|nr:hypothetical protein [Denitromonas halophila]TVO53840.1 hypothetical protein FHP91_13665 [Denitromonas halophila]
MASDYAESVENMKACMLKGTESECEQAIGLLRCLAQDAGAQTKTGRRLADMARKAEQIGVERFGINFGLPF